MNSLLKEYTKKKEFLICIDSDGTAMDTMDIKHNNCFIPTAVEIWGLQSIEEDFYKVWNKVNLYSNLRGINRYWGLVKTFEYLSDEFFVPDLAAIKNWLETTDEISISSLEKEVAKHDDGQLRKTLEWTYAVNKRLFEFSDDFVPFQGVVEGLSIASQVADVAVVSSAKKEEIHSEWTKNNLISYTQVILGQEAGSKSSCIKELINYGYQPSKILMLGDTQRDLEAALKNDILYYPILVGMEVNSWDRFINESLAKFLNGNFGGRYQKKLINEFEELF